MTPQVVGLVFARGGSRGVPRKNLADLGGRPLVAHAVRQAHSAAHVERVVVSTDDEEIAEVARAHGAEVPWLRPPELADDHSPEWAAWQHAAAWLRSTGVPDDAVFLSVPATAPLRATEDLDACVAALVGSDADLVLTVTPSRRSPYFNMVVRDAAGLVRVVADIDGAAFDRRQDAPEVFDVTTVAYATTFAHVHRASGVLDGKVRAVTVPAERAIDIDDELDLHLARLLHDHPFPA